MTISGPTTKSALILEWLRSETPDLALIDQSLGDVIHADLASRSQAFDRLIGPDADPGDAEENAARLCFAILSRWVRLPFVAALPTGAGYSVVEVEEDDIDDVYVIGSDEWRTESSGTFQLTKTAENLGSPTPRSPLAASPQLPQIRELRAAFERGEFDRDRSRLVLLSRGSAPYTVLEGNHRAVALWQAHGGPRTTLPWPAILVTSSSWQTSGLDHWIR